VLAVAGLGAVEPKENMVKGEVECVVDSSDGLGDEAVNWYMNHGQMQARDANHIARVLWPYHTSRILHRWSISIPCRGQGIPRSVVQKAETRKGEKHLHQTVCYASGGP
jgi:hypothetical protein